MFVFRVSGGNVNVFTVDQATLLKATETASLPRLGMFQTPDGKEFSGWYDIENPGVPMFDAKQVGEIAACCGLNMKESEGEIELDGMRLERTSRGMYDFQCVRDAIQSASAIEEIEPTSEAAPAAADAAPDADAPPDADSAPDADGRPTPTRRPPRRRRRVARRRRGARRGARPFLRKLRAKMRQKRQVRDGSVRRAPSGHWPN